MVSEWGDAALNSYLSLNIWIRRTECECGVSLVLRVISEAEIEPETRNWTICILMTINGI